jgi:sRNA-binding regulator protein Hfq
MSTSPSGAFVSEHIPANVTHLNRDPLAPAPRRVDAQGNGGMRPSGKEKFVAKGHDRQLQDAQFGNIPVVLTLMSGDTVEGRITRRDKFTITVLLANGMDAGKESIFYKHAIEAVLIDKQA